MSARSSGWRLCGKQRLRHEAGLSLIELMIGMTLGLVVLGAVLYVFAGNRASYRHQESLSLVQESGRFALEILSRDIRMAGYAGCGNVAFVESLSAQFDNANIVGGVEGANATTPDQITIRRADFRIATVEDMPSGDTVELDDLTFLAAVPASLEGAQMMITDCAYLETFEVANGGVDEPNDRLTATLALQRGYQPTSQVMRVGTVTYDVFDNALRQNNQPIVEGVTNMKILYGIDTTGNRSADDYEADPADWTQVVSVRIDLEIADGNVDLPFSTTVTLRNRVP